MEGLTTEDRSGIVDRTLPITVTAEGTRILLNNPLNERGKYLYLAYVAIFLLPAAFYMRGLLTDSFSPMSLLISVATAIVYLLVGFRYLNSAMRREELLITVDQVHLINGSITGTKKQSFDRAGITNFRYIPRPELTDHPLAGKTFDYLGFQVQQQVINEMHGDNKLAFDYNGETIAFGKNCYSWHVEEIQEFLGMTETQGPN